MTILIAKEIHCNGCGEWVRSYSGRIEDVWPTLAKEGWTRGKGRHFCGKCSRKLNHDAQGHQIEDEGI